MRKLGRRCWEWFWRGVALRQATEAAEAVPARARELQRRARLTAEVATRIGEPAEPFADAPVHAVRFELYRQALHWILACRAELSNDSEGPPESQAALGDSGSTFRRLRAWSNPRVLEIVGGSDRLDAMIASVEEGTFDRFPDSMHSLQSPRTEELRSVVEVLLDELGEAEQRVERLRRQRLFHGLLVIGTLAAFGLLWWAGGLWYERAYDLADGKPWVASSHLGPGGCPSPQQSCSASPTFFFHTLPQPNPSLEIDLGQVQEFSKVVVVNRSDCCTELAVPLVVSVSSDHTSWREVARRQTPFSTWRSEFEPVSARWVRLVVANTTMLHLARVRVVP